MSDFKLTVSSDTRAGMEEQLRKSMHFYRVNPLYTWRWWSGFIWGVVAMALFDVTDLHICAGECGGNKISLTEALQ
jgi:hypothetical protein